MTYTEIQENFEPELNALAEACEMTKEETMQQMTRLYDGYRFSYRSPERMYNPFSVLNALNNQLFQSYWFASGTPTFLVEMLKKTDFDLRKMDGIEVAEASLRGNYIDTSNPIPMLYQNGYLIIKKYDERFGLYTLVFPNEEVKSSFLKFCNIFS